MLYARALCFLLLFLSVAWGRTSKDKTLKFRGNGLFKIVQFTDLHFGHSPAQDQATQKVQQVYAGYDLHMTSTSTLMNTDGH
jgi:hypothetical protein